MVIVARREAVKSRAPAGGAHYTTRPRAPPLYTLNVVLSFFGTRLPAMRV
jgi:hypothetical protein